MSRKDSSRVWAPLQVAAENVRRGNYELAVAQIELAGRERRRVTDEMIERGAVALDGEGLFDAKAVAASVLRAALEVPDDQ